MVRGGSRETVEVESVRKKIERMRMSEKGKVLSLRRRKGIKVCSIGD